MCIRDRVFLRPVVGGQDDAPVHLNRLGLAVEIPGERALDPVSYTHLRAHETVLDLVCRLLLEKKKKQPTK